MTFDFPKRSAHFATCLHLRARSLLFNFIVFVCSTGPIASAANLFWDGSNLNWSNPTSWSTVNNASLPNPAAPPGASDVAIFNTTGINLPQTSLLGSGQSAAGLQFNSTGTVLIQGPLSLGASGALMNSGAGAVTLDTTLSLTAPQTWTNNSSNLFSSIGTLSLGGNQLIFTGTGNTTVSGPISGSGSLRKSGSGTLTLSGNNSFTGGFELGTAGQVRIGNPFALSSANPVSFSPASLSVFSLNGNSITVGGLAGVGSGGAPIVQNASATPATLTVNVPGAAVNDFSGSVADGAGGGALSITKSGTGTLTLASNNSFTGGVTINAGTLNVGPGALNPAAPQVVTFGPASTGVLSFRNDVVISGLVSNAATPGTPAVQTNGDSATLFVNNAVDNSFAGAVRDGSAGDVLSLTKQGAGVLTLGGNLTFTGPLAVIQGTVVLSGNNALSEVQMFGGTVKINNNNALNPASPPRLEYPAGIGGETTISLNGNSVAVGDIVDFFLSGNRIIQNASDTPGTLTIANNTLDSAFHGNIIDGPGGGALSIVKTGVKPLVLSGSNSFTGNFTINAGAVNMNGGSLAATVVNSAAFVYNSGAFNGRLIHPGHTLTLNADFTAGNGIEFDVPFSVASGRTITANGLGLDNRSTLTMAGGNLLLSTGATAANVNRGTFNLNPTLPFNLQGATLTNAGTLNLDGGSVTGATGLLSNGAGGTIAGNGAILSPFSNSGGLIAVAGGNTNIVQAFNNSGAIQLSSFTANITGGAISNTGSILGIGNIGNAINNSGSIEPLGGTLYLGGALTNDVLGMLRVGTDNQLIVIQGLASNAGTISLLGGTFDNNNFALTNTASGRITGRGTLFARGGVSNQGHVAFSRGITDVYGDVANATGDVAVGITASGEADVTFWDDVTNTSGLFRVAAGSSATFFGNFSGNGISGTGDVYFEADITPGSSPGLATFGGNVYLGGLATLQMELAGTSPATQYDRLNATGQVSLGGTLDVSLIDGFNPAPGNSFDILDWGTVTGTFDSVQLPILTGSLQWDISQLYTTGVLSVVSSLLPGDYNQNGTVDAADYVVWRKNDGTQTGYDTWRAHFGETAGNGSGASANAAVPEPATTMLIFALAGLCLRRVQSA